MTQSINLMPKSYRQKLGDHRVRRRYIIQTAIALIAVAALGVHQQFLLAQRKVTEAAQLEHVNQLRAAQAKCDQIQGLVDEGIQQLAAYERTALPIDLSRVIGTASSLFPDEVAVNSLHAWIQESQVSRSALERLKGQSTRSSASKKSADKKTETVRVLYCEFTGNAATGIEISNLLQNLENHPLFSNIQLDYSKAIIVNDLDAREFRIICEIDLQKRYQPTQSQTKSETDA